WSLRWIGHVDDRHGEAEVDEANSATQNYGVAARAPEIEAGNKETEGEIEDDGTDDVATEGREGATGGGVSLLRALHPELVVIHAVDEIDKRIGQDPDKQQWDGDETNETDDAVQVDGGHEALTSGRHHREQPHQKGDERRAERKEEQDVADAAGMQIALTIP